MRFSIATVLAFAASALAQTTGFDAITKPIKDEAVPAGSTYEIVWSPDATHPGTIKIGLLGGASQGTLDVIDTIATGVDGAAGSYSWKVDAKLGTLNTYGIMITLESDAKVFQYGFPFHITPTSGGSGSGSTKTDSTSTSGSGSQTSTTETTNTSAGVTTTTAPDSTDSTTFTTVPSLTSVSSTARSNLTTTGGSGSVVTNTNVVSQLPSSTKPTQSVATNGVASLAAGSFALFGGVAMAALAL